MHEMRSTTTILPQREADAVYQPHELERIEPRSRLPMLRARNEPVDHLAETETVDMGSSFSSASNYVRFQRYAANGARAVS